MKTSAVRSFLRAFVFLFVLALTSSVGMAQVQTTQETFILSGELPGNLITALINAGYGDYNAYESLVALRLDTNPEVYGILTDQFLNGLAACPAGSQMFTTLLKNYPAGSSLAMSTDCTVQTTNVRASGFFGTVGTSTLVSDISGVETGYFVHAGTTPSTADFTTPMTSWNVTSGGVTTTYNVFAIASGSVTEQAAVPTMTEWGMIIFALLIAASAAFYPRRRRTPQASLP